MCAGPLPGQRTQRWSGSLAFRMGAPVLVATLLAVHMADAQTPSPATAPRPFVEVPAAQPTRVTAVDLVRRALQANRELAAARLDLERGRARLRQAGLRPNPTLDLQQTTGRFTGSAGERDVSVGLALPIELGSKRQRRIDVAEAELASVEAEIAERERRLTREVLSAYADVVAAQRELQTTSSLHDLDEQTVRVVRTRVDERDAPPLELNLLLTEVHRLQSRRALLEGRVDAALITLKQMVGATPTDALAIDDSPLPADRAPLPANLDAAIAVALERRPDLKLARLTELAAEAGLRLARADAWPDLTISGSFGASRDLADLPAPLVPVPDDDRFVGVGVSIGLPFFNSNQGAKAEAGVAIRQAQMRRQFAEQVVRAEVTSAFRRVEAARAAVAIFEQDVLKSSSENVRVMRAAYELGEFRITDLINEQRRLLDSQRDYSDALVEGFRAIADLHAAMGLTFGGEP